jgi:hypothetical protein
MDVPFASTPALSRSLYTLVHALENAPSSSSSQAESSLEAHGAISEWITKTKRRAGLTKRSSWTSRLGSGLGMGLGLGSTSRGGVAASVLGGLARSVVPAVSAAASGKAGGGYNYARAKELLVGVMYLHELGYGGLLDVSSIPSKVGGRAEDDDDDEDVDEEEEGEVGEGMEDIYVLALSFASGVAGKGEDKRLGVRPPSSPLTQLTLMAVHIPHQPPPYRTRSLANARQYTSFRASHFSALYVR